MLTYNVAGTPTPFTAQCMGAFSEAEEAEILSSPSPLVTIKPAELSEHIARCEHMAEPVYQDTATSDDIEAMDDW